MKRIFAVLLSFFSISEAIYAQEVRMLADIKLAPAKNIKKQIIHKIMFELPNKLFAFGEKPPPETEEKEWQIALNHSTPFNFSKIIV